MFEYCVANEQCLFRVLDQWYGGMLFGIFLGIGLGICLGAWLQHRSDYFEQDEAHRLALGDRQMMRE